MCKPRFRYVVVALVSELTLATGPSVAETSGEMPIACQRFLSGDRSPELAKALDEAADRSPQQPCSLLFRGLLHREQGELPAAVESLGKGAQRHPHHLPVLLELAATLSWNQQVEAALARYRQAVALEPNSLPARLGEARMLSWMGELKAAQLKYSELERQRPRNPETLKGLAFVFRARLKLEAARTLYREVLDRDPEDTEAAEGLAAIEAIERWQVELRGDRETSRAGDRRDLFGVSLRYQRRTRSFMTLTFDRDGLIFRDPLLGVDSIARPIKTVRGSFSVGLGSRTTAGFELESRREETADSSTTSRFVGAEITRRLPETTTILAGLRYGESSGKGSSLLAFFGALFAPGEHNEILIQLFGSQDPRGKTGGALAGRWQATFSNPWLLRVDASAGRDSAGTFVRGSIHVGYRFSKQVEIGTGYQLYDGRSRQTSVITEVTFRF